jgi:EEF1A lysine methyltransferase 4
MASAQPLDAVRDLLENPAAEDDFTPVSTITYSTLDYWRFRFLHEKSKEWLASFNDVRDLLCAAIPDRNARILLVGTGNSSLPMDMADAGFSAITATDYADTVIDAMRARTAGSHPQISWNVADMTDLAPFADASFDVILDKAAMDAVLAERGDTWDPPDDLLASTASIGRAACRVLVPGGLYLQLSFAQKHFRRAYLCQPGLPWVLESVTPVPVGLGYFWYAMRRDGGGVSSSSPSSDDALVPVPVGAGGTSTGGS